MMSSAPRDMPPRVERTVGMNEWPLAVASGPCLLVFSAARLLRGVLMLWGSSSRNLDRFCCRIAETIEECRESWMVVGQEAETTLISEMRGGYPVKSSLMSVRRRLSLIWLLGSL